MTNPGNIAVTITVAGNIPSQLDSSTFIEWDLMIDADRNSVTSPWTTGSLAGNQMVINGLGPDYMVRYYVMASTNSGGQIWDGTTRKNSAASVPVQINGNQITLTFSPSDIGGSTDFYFVVLVRNQGGPPDFTQLLLFDKAPNTGYYEYKAGTLTLISGFSMQTTVQSPLATSASTTSAVASTSTVSTSTSSAVTGSSMHSAEESAQGISALSDGNLTMPLLVLLIGIVAVGLVVFVFRSRIGSSKIKQPAVETNPKTGVGPPRDEAIQLLRKRLASGEIQSDEYHKQLKDLQE